MRRNLEELFIGQTATKTKTFNTDDVLTFSELSTDKNPIHIDEDYAKNSAFKERIVHGFLVGSLISAVIANDLPGEGSVYLHQDMDFKKPVKHGDTITARVEIVNIRKDKSIITLKTECINLNGDIVISGQAVIKLL